FAVTGDVAADALVVVLLAVRDQRLPCRGVDGLLPERGRRFVAGRALGVADVVGAAGFPRRRGRRALEVDRRDRRVQLAHLGGHFFVAWQAAPERDQSVREIRAAGWVPRRDQQLFSLRDQRRPFGTLARDERLIAAAGRAPRLELVVDAPDRTVDLHAPQVHRLGPARVDERTRAAPDDVDAADALELVGGRHQKRVADLFRAVHPLAHLAPQDDEIDRGVARDPSRERLLDRGERDDQLGTSRPERG